MKLIKFALVCVIIFSGMNVYAFKIRNTYTANLICIQAASPHKKFTIRSHRSSVELKAEGKYNCKTSDHMYMSVCSVSEFQPVATFNTNDGSASCTTPVKI